MSEQAHTSTDLVADFHTYASLLRMITDSWAFWLYISVVAHSGHLLLPKCHNIDKYKSFGANQNLHWITSNFSVVKGKTAKAKGKGMETATAAEEGKGNGTARAMGKRQEGGGLEQAALSEAQEGDAEAKDVAVSDVASVDDVNQMTAKNVATACRKYICIQVAHFGTATILRQ
jgi:hypothetical protein